MPHVVEINDLDRLADARLLWSALLPQTRQASFFQSLDWLLTYWKHYGAAQRLRVLVAYSGSEAIGILPLVVRVERRSLVRLRILTYPLDFWGNFYGPIGPNPTATLLAGLNHVRRTARDWDLIELPWVDAGGADRGRTPRAMKNAGLPPHADQGELSALVDLAGYGDWQSYWASRSSHWRTNVRRSEKKLAARGRVEYLRYRPQGIAWGQADPRWDLYEECERIAAASWQGASTSGTTLVHDSIRPFLRDCHEASARRGALDLNLLLVDGKSAAFNYAYQYRGQVTGLRTGYEPQFEHEGAGTVLQSRMIADSFARGDGLYDLGPSYTSCKRHWLTDTRASYRYTHFPTWAPWAQAARLKRSIAGRLV